jgi:hypothetical protein
VGLEVPPLSFLRKKRGCRYLLKGILTPSTRGYCFSLYDSLIAEEQEGFIFLEDDAKVHEGFVKGPRAANRILGFD